MTAEFSNYPRKADAFQADQSLLETVNFASGNVTVT